MREETPGELPPHVDPEEFKKWKPEAQQKALELLREHKDSEWRPFYCLNPSCDGKPHDAWAWPHARADQRPPKWSGDWLTLIMSGGRGSGKTRTGSEITHRVTNITPRISLIAATGPDLRETMIEGVSGILATSPPGKRPLWEPSKKKLTWPNGCIANGFSAEEPDRLRGPQCLVAGTMIETEFGSVPIEDVRTGDRVWTRVGLRMVTAVASKVDVVMTFGPLTGTVDHPVWTENRGWVRMDSVTPDDSLVLWNGKSIEQAVPTAMATASITSVPAGSMSKKSARSHPDSRSTTSTGTVWTTEPRTSSRSLLRSIENSTATSPSRTPALAATVSSSSSGAGRVSGVPTAKLRSTEKQCAVSTLGGSAVTRPSASSAARSSLPAKERCAAPPASIATERVYDLTVPDQPEFFANGILVHNSGFCWGDEPAHWPLVSEVWDNMLFGLRIGKNPKVVATSTPKPIKWMRELMKDELTVVHRVSTYANLDNLAETFKRTILDRYEGTRLGRQELHGEVLEDVEGALWMWDMFQWIDEAPELVRIVVAVDPAGTANTKSDETGIIVLGIDAFNKIYILEDLTGKYSPAGWGDKVAAACDEWNADAIVAEKNYGGDMVRHVLETAKFNKVAPRIIMVDSRRGKALRAEPIVALYEKKKFYHVGQRGDLALLETEQTTWVPGEGASPNRVDALVHGATELAKNSMPSQIADPNKLLRRRRGGEPPHLRAV